MRADQIFSLTRLSFIRSRKARQSMQTRHSAARLGELGSETYEPQLRGARWMSSLVLRDSMSIRKRLTEFPHVL